MMRTQCFGSCPMYWVEITGDGQVTYCGMMHVDEYGERTRTISLVDVGRLADAAKQAGFFRLQDRYMASVTDGSTTLVEIELGGRRKTVMDYLGELAGMPQSLTDLQELVDEVAGTAEWIGERSGSHPGKLPGCAAKIEVPQTFFFNGDFL